MPPRPLPVVPDSREQSGSGRESPVKRSSAYISAHSEDRTPRLSNDNQSKPQYSGSMPVLDAKAPYAVSSVNKIHHSTSSPRSLSNQSFESSSDHSKTQRPGGEAVTGTYRESRSSEDHQPAISVSNSAAENREKKNFMDTPLNRNSSTSAKVLQPAEVENSNSIDTNERPDYHIKIVCVGDGGCGKTCLMLTYTYGTFPTTYIPTVFENYLTIVRAPNDKLIELALWDTAGQEEYDRLRVLSYPEVNVLLICFAINSPASLDNVVDKWVPEVSHFCQDIPFILVGLKADLRQGSSPDIGYEPTPGATKSSINIPIEQAKAIAKDIGANRYMECSARLNDGLSEVFNTAISIVLAEHLGHPSPPIAPIPGEKPPPALTKPVSKPSKKAPKSKPAVVSSAPLKKKKEKKCVIL